MVGTTQAGAGEKIRRNRARVIWRWRLLATAANECV
uniref:Uncharacterized protein n=1 Tax=Arundo donax TaxID=35708 RepID=A0A0A9A4M2_ARUDO